MPELLRIESNERLDLQDFEFMSYDSMDQFHRHPIDQVLTNPSLQRTWILRGFEMTNPSAKQLKVTKGAALLARRDGAVTNYGCLASEGDNEKTVDMASYSAGTYGIYIKFSYEETDVENRIFWDPSGTGDEYAKSIATRYSPDWQVRIEGANPGAEWFKIGEVAQATMAITDQRDFYFEGKVSDDYTDTWGDGANDRNDDRAQYGIGDFQSFAAAMRRKLTDIGGREWYKTTIDGSSLPNKLEAEDFLSKGDYWISGFATSDQGGLVVRTTDGVCYSNGTRVAESLATPLGYYDFTLPDNFYGYVEVKPDGTFVATDILGPYVGCRIALIQTASGSISLLQDERGTNDADFVIMGQSPSYQLHEIGHSDWTIGLSQDRFFIDRESPITRFVAINDNGVALNSNLYPGSNEIFSVCDAGRSNERFQISAADSDSFTVVKAFSRGSDNTEAYRLSDQNDNNYFEIEHSVAGSGTYHHSSWRGSGSAGGTAPYIRLFEDISSGKPDRIMSRGAWTHGRVDDDTTNDTLAGMVQSTHGFLVYTNENDSTPLVRFIRSTSTAGGAIDFMITGTETKIRSQGKNFYVGPSDTYDMRFQTNNLERFTIHSDGKLATGGETLPDVSTYGLCLNQGSNDNNILTFKADVSHTYSGIDSDTYGLFFKASPTNGGTYLIGVGSGYTNDHGGGLVLEGSRHSGQTSTPTTSTRGLVTIRGTVNGESPLSNTTVLSVDSNGTTFLAVQADGDVYSFGQYYAKNSTSISPFDDHNDAIACRDLSRIIAGNFNDLLQYNKKEFESFGILKDGFLNINVLQQLLLGTVDELYGVLSLACQKLGTSYNDLRKQYRTA